LSASRRLPSPRHQSFHPARSRKLAAPERAHRGAVSAGRLDRHHRAPGRHRLQNVWGQTVVIENKPGAGGKHRLRHGRAFRSRRYTIFTSGRAGHQPVLYPSLSYGSGGDFAPVTLLITQPNLMCVPLSKPAKSVKEFIAYCNQNKGT